jgi:hypothetical protein
MNTINEPVSIGSRITDADFHWSNLTVPSEPILGQSGNSDSYAPEIAVENEMVYVVWYDKTNLNGVGGTSNDIFLRIFDGNSWSSIEVVSEPTLGGADDNDGESQSPDIAVENGNIYIVWKDTWKPSGYTGTDEDIFFRHFDGTQWGPIQVISEPNFSGDDNTDRSLAPSIAVENGKVFVVWRDNTDITADGTTDFDVFYRANITATGWENIQIISESVVGVDTKNSYTTSPIINVDNNKQYIVWTDDLDHDGAGLDTDIFYRANLTTSWEDIQVISEPIKGRDVNQDTSYDPAIAVENDKLYVVWWDDNNTNGASSSIPDFDIFYKCNLTQSNWEDTQVLSEPTPGADINDGSSETPDIAVENGVIYVIWKDNYNYTNSSKTVLDYDIFFIYNSSSIGGWSNFFVVSEPVLDKEENIGSIFEDPSIAVNKGKCHIVWDDDNDTNSCGSGDHDISYRRTFVAPSLTSGTVTPTIGNTSTVFKYSVTYMDPDNEAPKSIIVKIDGTNYVMTATDPGDKYYLDGKEYYIEITHLEVKTHDYQFRVNDGNYTRFTNVYINPVVENTAPNITTSDNTTAIEDVYYEVDYEYDDIDVVNIGQLGNWSLETDITWLNLNSTTGILNGTPSNDHVGDFWINITIDDGIDIDWTNFTLTVEQVNDPPILLTEMLANATEDQFYEVMFEADDIDSPLLFWNISTNASWLVLNNTLGTINGTPLNEDVGDEFWVNVIIEDGEFIDNRNFSLEVENVNDFPTIITEAVTKAKIDELYSVDYEASDVDPTADILIWSLDTNASWLSINSSTGVLSGTPAINDTGTYYVNVSVSDGNGGLDWNNFTLEVVPGEIELNLPPIITTEDVKKAEVDKKYSVDYEATDEDSPQINLTWTMRTDAGWLMLNETTGVLDGTPGGGDVGSYWVNITVSDGEGGFAYTNFTIQVTQPSVENKIPELTDGTMTPSSGDTATTFTFTVTYTDDDNYPGEVWVWIDGEKHKMTPDQNDTEFSDGVLYSYETILGEGDHSYYFTASDGIDNAVPGDTSTPTTPEDAVSTPKISKEEEDKEEKEEENYLQYIAIIMIIIVVLIILSFALTRRKERAPIEEVELEESESGFECPECGAQISYGEPECPECGAIIEEEIEIEDEEEDIEDFEEDDEEFDGE